MTDEVTEAPADRQYPVRHYARQGSHNLTVDDRGISATNGRGWDMFFRSAVDELEKALAGLLTAHKVQSVRPPSWRLTISVEVDGIELAAKLPPDFTLPDGLTGVLGRP